MRVSARLNRDRIAVGGASFDFFLTRPYEQFTITRAADIETAVLFLIDEVSAQLTRALGLRGCRFQLGVAGVGEPPRLQRDGQVMWSRVSLAERRMIQPSRRNCVPTSSFALPTGTRRAVRHG
jgi:hypothetical protein